MNLWITYFAVAGRGVLASPTLGPKPGLAMEALTINALSMHMHSGGCMCIVGLSVCVSAMNVRSQLFACCGRCSHRGWVECGTPAWVWLFTFPLTTYLLQMLLAL
jgi:hypothetical protein